MEEHQLGKIFSAYADDGTVDGHIRPQQAKHMLRDAGAEPSDENASAIVAAIDTGDHGKISFHQLKAAVDAAAESVDRRVLPIFATLTLTFTSQGVQFPVLPQLARDLGLSAADLGFVSASNSLARLLTNMPFSMLAERIGRRPLLIAGPAIGAVGMAGFSFSNDLLHLAVANGFIGVGMACSMAGASLYLSDIATPRNRAQTTAPILQSALIGFSIGPAIGGTLSEFFGLHLPFAMCSGGLISASIAAAFLLPETLHEAQRRRRRANTAAGNAETSQGTAYELLNRPALQGLHAIVFMNGFSQGAMPVSVILFALEALSFSSMELGAMLTANVLLMTIVSHPATVLSDRLESRKTLMTPALLASAAFKALLPLATTQFQFTCFMSVSAVASAVSMPSISPLFLDYTSEAERAKALAMRQMSQDVGALIGASLMGIVASSMGTAAAINITAALQLISAGFFAQRVPSKRILNKNS